MWLWTLGQAVHDWGFVVRTRNSEDLWRRTLCNLTLNECAAVDGWLDFKKENVYKRFYILRYFQINEKWGFANSRERGRFSINIKNIIRSLFPLPPHTPPPPTQSLLPLSFHVKILTYESILVRSWFLSWFSMYLSILIFQGHVLNFYLCVFCMYVICFPMCNILIQLCEGVHLK